MSAGARVELDVSADGTSITRFQVYDMPFPSNPANASCASQKLSYTWTGAMPIHTPAGYPPDFHFFGNMSLAITPVVPFEFDGSFEAGTVGGRLTYMAPDFPSPGCSTQGNISYTASAPGGCQGSPEYLAQQAQINALTTTMQTLKKKIKKTKKALALAENQGRDLVAKRLWKKLQKLKRKYRKAREARSLLLAHPVC